MWVKIIRDFHDLESEKPDEVTPAGTSLNVKADRGADLIALGLAVETSDAADVTPSTAE